MRGSTTQPHMTGIASVAEERVGDANCRATELVLTDLSSLSAEDNSLHRLH